MADAQPFGPVGSEQSGALGGGEVGQRPVLDDDALGAAGGAGGVDDVGRVLRAGAGHGRGVGDRGGRQAGADRGVGEVDDVRAREVGQCRAEVRRGDHGHRAGVGDDVRQPVGGVRGVQVDVGPARAQHREQRHDQVE